MPDATVRSTMPRACVIGHPIAHSRSPLIHRHWLAALGLAGAYDLADVPPEDFADFIARMPERHYVGGNVTVPHKEAAFRIVARRDAVADAVGAVNTLWFEKDELVGGNSDPHGFISNLDEGAPGWDATAARAVVLGGGGAARAAAYALIGRGFDVALVNRTEARAQAIAAEFGARVTGHCFDDMPRLMPTADLLVNCTSLGMAGKPPLDIDIDVLQSSAVVCDVVYAPMQTPLLVLARRRGHRTVDGLGMLLHQAGFGFRKWFGVAPVVTDALRALVEADLLGSTGNR